MNLRELQKKIGKGEGLSIKALQSFSQQLLYSLRLMEKCNVLHADLKPDNILVNEAKTLIKLCDFGSAFYSDENAITPYLASRFYRAPEIMLGMKYSYGIDIWSLGCSLYECFTGRILFHGRDNNQMLKLIFELRGKPANKFLRKGTFRDGAFGASHIHFDDNFNFLSKELDKVTQQVKIVELQMLQPTGDLGQMLFTYGDVTYKKKLAQFKDFLEKMLMVLFKSHEVLIPQCNESFILRLPAPYSSLLFFSSHFCLPRTSFSTPFQC